MADPLKARSRFLSGVLRHNDPPIGVKYDRQGWVDISELLAAAAAHGTVISREELDFVVENNDKKRLTISPDGKRIRAAQGHSINVDLGLAVRLPPAVLYHGTVGKFIGAIRREGLRKMSRHAVHLSATRDTATIVGGRRGRAVVLVIDSFRMNQDGYTFEVSDNGVWLTEHVPLMYIRFPE
ncbi:RNA 2'-phosphotransferase [Paraburkholderia sp. EG287A]|uniref:RNA 2'-phosphotransferase n=1 Tax=Paraburkholderia sp. EG287A TaxID=3237012 RepID=UPI0034D28ED1